MDPFSTALGPLYTPQEPQEVKPIESYTTPQPLANQIAVDAGKKEWLWNLGKERRKLDVLSGEYDVNILPPADQEILAKYQTGDPAEIRQPTPMTKDEANAAGEEYGLRFNEDTTDEAFAFQVDRAKERRHRDRILAMAPDTMGGKGLTTMLALGTAMVDPVNIAIGFIPILGEARLLSLMERFGRTGGRLLAGTLEAGAVNVAVEPFVYSTHERLKDDYTFVDSFLNVTLGSILGGGVHASMGRIGDEIQVSQVRRLFDENVTRREVRDFLYNTLDGPEREIYQSLAKLREVPRFKDAAPDEIHQWMSNLSRQQQAFVLEYALRKIERGEEPDVTVFLRDTSAMNDRLRSSSASTEVRQSPAEEAARIEEIVGNLPAKVEGQTVITDIPTGIADKTMIRAARRARDKGRAMLDQITQRNPELRGYTVRQGDTGKADYKVNPRTRVITVPKGKSTIPRVISAAQKALEVERSRGEFVKSPYQTLRVHSPERTKEALNEVAEGTPYNVDQQAGEKVRVALEVLQRTEDKAKLASEEVQMVDDYIASRPEGGLSADDMAEYKAVRAQVDGIAEKQMERRKMLQAFASCVGRG